jgi:two-component system, OmpR family, response regulator
MLVLSRRLNEKVVFPGLGVTVQVVSVRPGVVRLGIEAPSEVQVLREELLQQPVADVTVTHRPAERG